MEDFDVEDEGGLDFPCPYCSEDFDIVSLCSHLKDEHSCESKVTICPICSVKIAQEMLSHSIGICLEWRRLRRVAIPNSQALSLLGPDLREAHLQEEITKTEVIDAQDFSAKNKVPAHIWKSSFDHIHLVRGSLGIEEWEKRMRQAAGRSGFMQDLFLSTLLGD